MAVKAKQQYYADETTIKKEAREFGMIDELKDKLDSIEYGAQVNIIEEVQENGVPLEIVDKSVNVLVPEVIDNLYTIDPNNSLSAKQGKILYDMIKNLLARGRFLSTWNTATGLPVTNPEESPYEYKAGDYYIVGIVAAEGGTNFRPEPGEYVINVASDEQETSEVHVSDIYVYDGENWVLLINSTRELAVDDYVDYTYQSTNPVENQAIAKEFVKKQNKFYTVSTTQPSNPVEGDEWYDATNDKVFYWDGTQWKEMGGGSTYTAGLHISIDPNDNNKISVVEWSATSSALGLVKLGSDTPQNVAPNNVSSKSNRTYRIQANNSGQLMVNVPWEDTTYISGTGISISNNRVISCTVKPVTVGPTAPSTPGTGDLWYDTNKNTMFLYKNNSWTIIGPEIYPITKADYDALTPAEQGDGRFFLITDNDGTIYVDWDNVQNRPMYIGATAPANPCEGYIWYDTDNNVLKVYDGTQWNEVGGGGGCCYTAGNGIDITNDEISIDTTVVATKTDLNSKQDVFHTTSSSQPANPSEGDEWYDTTNDVLKVYDGSNWIVTGKTYTAGTNIDITNDVISADTQFVVVDTLPAAATADVNKVYILGPIGSGADKYEEYIVQDAVEGHFESASTIDHDFVEYNVGQVEYGDRVWNKNGAITNKYVAMDNLVITGDDYLNIGDDNNSESIENVEPGDMPYVYENQDETHNKLLESPYISTYPNTYGSFDIYYSDSEITWVAGTPKQYVKIGETSPDLSGKQDKATSGSGAPSTTPSYIGQMYVDTANDNLYVATGTSSSSDWTAVDTNTTYTAGDGIDITNNEISVDVTDIIGTGLSEDANNNLIVDSTVVALKSDLTNYYTKTETYTKTEVDNLISSFGSFEVVASLPSVSTASEKTIYLLGPIGTGADKYEEWIVTEDSQQQKQWTKIGETSVDLSNYAQKSEVLTKTNTTAFTPTGDYQPATKKYVDDRDTYIGASEPTSNKVEGRLWYDTTNDILKVYDGTNWNATGKTYTEGDGIDIINDVISADIIAGNDISITSVHCMQESDRKGPAPSGFHIPSKAEWEGLVAIMDGLSLGGGEDLMINLHLPYAGSRSFKTASVSLNNYGTYWTSTSKNPGSNAYYFYFYDGRVTLDFNFRTYGRTIRAFKNSYEAPDSSWTVIQGTLGNGGIFWDQTNGLISITSDGSTGYTIMDKNLGATTVYSNGDTLSEANCGCFYQWGNNYGFAWSGNLTTSSTQADTSGYGPHGINGYYEGNTFIIRSSSPYDWSSSDNSDLWGDISNSTHKECGPGQGTLVINSTVDISGKQDKATSGSTAPSTTPTYVGQQYVDTTNDKLYVATGTSSSSDWIVAGKTYTAGDGINIDANNEISVDSSDLAGTGLSTDANNNLIVDTTVIQGKLTAGTNIDITNDVISADTQFVLVDTLPSIYTADENKIYILGPIGTGADKYEEWIKKVSQGQGGGVMSWVKIGETSVDISGKQDKATSGSTAPSTTPSYVGQQYIDTTADKMYVATGTTSSSDWTEVGAGSGDMLYSDYGWTTLTGATVTLALRSEITPSANFTVNKPNDLKDGQFYVLRVDNGATAYTMTLGTDVTNPYSEDLTLSANTIANFTFLAKDGELELQPSTEIDISGKQDKATSGSTAPSTTPSYIGQQYVDTTNNILYVAKGTSSSSDWIVAGKTYTAGNGIDITNDEISVDTDVIQEKLAAGTGIEITGGQICTTESDRKGPAPSGFHVPSISEWQGVKTIMDGLSLTTGDGWKINLHIPFAGSRASYSADISSQGSFGNYWSSSPYGSDRPSSARNFTLTSFSSSDSSATRANGYSVRAFANEFVTPTSSWAVVQGTLGSAGIFWNQSEGLISITSDGSTGYTIMDKNLGATTVYNSGDTLTQANMGNMYQWGNNYGFPSTGTISNTSSTQVDASGYGPSTANGYYEDDTYITVSNDWSSVYNDDLWGNTSNSTHQECTTGPLTISSTVNGFNPSNTGTEGQVLTKTSTGYDWANAQGGGGNVIAMTQAEYNALTTEEKNDGKLRIITDAPTEDISVDWANIANKPIELSTQSGNTLTSLKIWVGSQTDYEALATKDTSTLYFTTNVVS